MSTDPPIAITPHEHVGGPFWGCDICGQIRDAEIHQVAQTYDQGQAP